MRGFDNDIRSFAAEEIRKTGVDLRFNTNIESLTPVNDGYEATLTDGSTLVVDTYCVRPADTPTLKVWALSTPRSRLIVEGTSKPTRNSKPRSPVFLPWVI